MELNVGDVIQVNGWVMLQGMEDGQKYKVARIQKSGFNNIYFFTKARGKKIVVGHSTSDIDMCINSQYGNNNIEIIKRG